MKTQLKTGSSKWNDYMFSKHPSPEEGIAGKVGEYRANKIIKIINKTKQGKDFTIVEIGCEAGNLLKDISKKFPEAKIVGFDISERALEEAKNILKKDIILKKADITKDTIKIPFEKIDFLICSETLEHIQDTKKAMQGLENLCDERTMLIITVPNENFKNKIKKILKKLKIFNILFRGIEKGFSEWHIHNFSKKDVLKLISIRFKILKYVNILYLHHLIVARKKDDA